MKICAATTIILLNKQWLNVLQNISFLSIITPVILLILASQSNVNIIALKFAARYSSHKWSKKFKKLANICWSYGQKHRGPFFWLTASKVLGAYFANMGKAKTPGGLTPNFLVVDVRDGITCFKFGDNRFRSLTSAEVQILPFPIDFDGRPYYNILTLVWVYDQQNKSSVSVHFFVNSQAT